MLNVVLYIILGLICLVACVITLIFMVIAYANRKPSKHLWLLGFLSSLVGLGACIFLAMWLVAEKTADFKNKITDSVAYENTDLYQTTLKNPQVIYLQSLVSEKAPDDFYLYLGYQDYRRYPLRYPYSLHLDYYITHAELYNEKNVLRFDETNNGEIYEDLDNIERFNFDKNLLLIQQQTSSTRSNKPVIHYQLFDFNTRELKKVNTLDELFKLAKQKGYVGADSLVSIKNYELLF